MTQAAARLTACVWVRVVAPVPLTTPEKLTQGWRRAPQAVAKEILWDRLGMKVYSVLIVLQLSMSV